MTTVKLARDGRRVRLTLGGVVDCLTSTLVRDALCEALLEGPDELVIDMSGVTFIDASGIGSLVLARNRALQTPVALVASAPVARMLSICGLDAAFGTGAPDDPAQRVGRGIRPRETST